jgi:CheY-like chemotaxis protein
MPDKTILIVDDRPANIAAALAILKDQYRTRVATSGAKALEHAGTADKPDLILLDVTNARYGWLRGARACTPTCCCAIR